MSQDTYDLFVKRLKEERERAKLTQKEAAAKLRMSESHYSKAEAARRRLSFFETKYLCETDLDSFYIFTKKRVDHGDVQFLSECDYAELLCHYDIVCMAMIRQGRKMAGSLDREDKRVIEYCRYLLAAEVTDKTILKKHRQYRDCNQHQMAGLLGVDSKKLRDLERGKLLPDSELIWQMSSRLDIPYFLVLKDKNGLLSEICYWLKRMEPGSRNMVLEIMQKYHGTLP
ncbi:MAG: transcriptional regulator [Lachnospiraceae bacterium]|nr:transcriptional regulator [Lachnospiraceae bacterium]